MFARMSERDRRALFLVGAFLIAIVVYTQAIEPLVFRFQNALGRLERSEQLSAGYIQKIRMLPRREARLAELEQEKSAVDTYFKVSPASRSAPAETLIDELSSYASITGVTFGSWFQTLSHWMAEVDFMTSSCWGITLRCANICICWKRHPANFN